MLKQPLNAPTLLPDGDEGYVLMEDYTYEWTYAGDRWRITVPKGFVYDGASVPRIVWTLSGITPDGLIRAAALVHDALYACSGRPPDGMLWVFQEGKWFTVQGATWPRSEADKLFARIMVDSGVSPLKVKLAYAAVRTFGFTGWD